MLAHRVNGKLKGGQREQDKKVYLKRGMEVLMESIAAEGGGKEMTWRMRKIEGRCVELRKRGVKLK